MGVFLKAAYEVLKAEGRPLSAAEVTDIAIRRGLVSSGGQTPWQTMKAKLSVDILQSGTRSLFKRSDKGRFALREWTDVQEHVADRYQKALFDEEIVVFPTDLRTTYVPSIGVNTAPFDSEGLLAECYPMRRRAAEDDLTVIQLVSVFVVKHADTFLTYKRTLVSGYKLNKIN
jgi:hypothetical protein